MISRPEKVPALGSEVPEARSRRKTGQHNLQLFSGTTVPGSVSDGRGHSWASPPPPPTQALVLCWGTQAKPTCVTMKTP